MNKTQLITALRAHLADKEDIANEAAPALALMRYAVVELEKPTSGGTGVDTVEVENLRRDLASSEKYVGELVDALNDREGLLYILLADFGMVPEVDDEPVDSLAEAIEQQPDILDALQDKISIINASQGEDDEDKDRFIAGVRNLLEPIAPQGAQLLSLQEMWNLLETASDSYASREQAIVHRDNLLLQADTRLLAIREKLGISEEESGSVEQLENAVIDLIMKQRDAALAADEPADDVAIDGTAQADDMLEHVVEECLALVGLEWEDVNELPRQVKHLKDNPVLGGWVSDAIDLAHAVRGNLAPENRVMAKAAEAIILNAPGGKDA